MNAVGNETAPSPKVGRIAFVHDHRFVCTEGFVGSHAQFESALWDRYLRFCDRLTVVGREGESDDPSELYVSSHPDVDFLLLEDRGRGVGRLMQGKAVADTFRKIVAEHDAIVARIPSMFGFYAIEEARRQGKPCAIEAVGCPWDALTSYGSLAGRIYAPIQFAQMRKAVGKADHVIYVTERFLQDRYPTRANNTAIASNVELTPFDPAAENALDPEVLDRRLAKIAGFDPSRELRIGLVGTLRGRTKGIQHALIALRDLLAEYPMATLHVLGGGDRAPWQAEAASLGLTDKAVFHGTLPSGQPVLDWLDGMDIYIQPSLQEGLPRALIEAMSRALPAIGSDRAGIPELLLDERIVPAAKPDALCSAIAELVRDRATMEADARRNFAKASQYTSDKLSERRRVFFENVLADARA